MADITIITGCTATGKSAYAEEIAAQKNGIIINADSMQVYAGLNIITAQPVTEAHHRLYGYIEPAIACNAARWRQDVLTLIEALLSQNYHPILVGGTGLYIKALLEGIADIPELDPDIIQQINNQTPQENFEILSKLDPEHHLKPNDQQRIVRALSVLKTTGKPIHYWQQQPTKALPYETHKILLQAERDWLYQRINQRFLDMLEQGALAEVKSLKQQNLAATLPAMKAHGVPELMAYLDNRITLEAATEKATQHVRNYAKRQGTWFRHQMEFDEVIEL